MKSFFELKEMIVCINSEVRLTLNKLRIVLIEVVVKKLNKKLNRRDLLRFGVISAIFTFLLGLVTTSKKNSSTPEQTVWQIDPNKCVQCGNCSKHCVLEESAVKCVHAFDICGYCKLCGGYHQANISNIDSAAENRLCPTDAIKRTFLEDPYYQYSIDEKLCVGCGICVAGCSAFGNGSLFLQVKHDRCLNCNECEIAIKCPADAFKRVPMSKPYLLKG